MAFLVNVVGGSVTMHEVVLYEENYNLRQLGLIPGLSNLMAYPSTWILRNIAAKEFWGAIGNFDPIPYWESLTVSALVLYGQDDTNVPSAESAAKLRSLGKSNIDAKIYEGSGHALEDPKGTGDSVFREDALKDIRDFIYSTSVLR